MAKKKPEPEVTETLPEGYIEITPEQLTELQGADMQTVMSIGLAEKLYLEDLSDRIFYLDTDVDADILHTVTMQIYKINGIDFGLPEDKRKPIILMINSGGGDVLNGIGLMDTIKQSKTPVLGICAGYAMSMAFAIFAVCHTRLSIPNAVFMYHDGYESVANTATKVKDWTIFSPKLDERVDKMIAESSKLTIDYLSSIKEHDNYWFADEMIEKGIVDGIIGKDIEMEEIFNFMSDMICCHEDVNNG